jgi:hypothetical protein
MPWVWVLSDFGDDADCPEGVGTFVFSTRERAEGFVGEFLTRKPLDWERHWCSSRARDPSDDATYYVELQPVDDDGESDPEYERFCTDLQREYPPLRAAS